MRTLIISLLLLISVARASTINISDPGYINVSCSGKTIEDAKSHCFQKAIETLVGIALVSQTQSTNNQLTRDEIVKYSAGYIDQYEILNQNTSFGTVNLLMDVVVKSSKIHERLFGKGATDKDMNGDQLETQYNTFLKSAKDSDRYVKQILNDFPQKAFNISVEKTDFFLDTYRNAQFLILYNLKWDDHYLEAVNELATQLAWGDKHSPKEIYIEHKAPGDFFGRGDMHYFNDSIMADNISNGLNARDIFIAVQIFDERNQPIHAECFFPTGTTRFTWLDDIRFTIRGAVKDNGRILIKVRQNSSLHMNLGKATRVELSITNGCHLEKIL